MVFPIDTASPAILPMRGGCLEVAFRSREDAMVQMTQYLPLQSLFVEATVFPKPFCELLLTVTFPGGASVRDLPARVIQIVALGEQKGFLLQFLGSFQALEDKLRSELQSYVAQPASGSVATPPVLLKEPVPTGMVDLDLNGEGLDLDGIEDLDLDLDAVEDLDAMQRPAWAPNLTPELMGELDLDLTQDEAPPTADSSAGPLAGKDHKPIDRMTMHERLRKLNVNERARLASRADKVTRSLLLRDVEPQVIMFMLKNPHLTRSEVVEITRSPRINYNIAKIILSNKTWAQNEEIRFNLAVNPKTPLPEALKLLPGLNLTRLREIAKNQGMRNRIKQTALRLVLERAT